MYKASLSDSKSESDESTTSEENGSEIDFMVKLDKSERVEKNCI